MGTDARNGGRVLIVMSEAFPGESPCANFMRRLTAGMRRCGNETLIIAPRRPGDGLPREGADASGARYASFDMPVKPRLVPYYPHRVRALRPGFQDCVRRALRDGPWDAAILLGESWWAFEPVRKICRAANIPVVPLPMEWFAPSFTRLAGLSWPDQMLLRRRTYPKCDGIMGISRLWTEFAEKYGLPSTVIPAISKFSDDELPQVLPRSDGRFRLVFSGRWMARELPITLLKGLELALRRGCDVELSVLGGAGNPTSISQKIQERPAMSFLRKRPELRERVRFAGWLPDDEFQRQMEAADAFVLLRDGNRESRALFPTRLPEYLATGRPLIVSDAGDLALYLEHARSAFVIPPGDRPEELAEAIGFLASHPEDARRIGMGGREALATSFSQAKIGRRAADFLATLHRSNRESPASDQAPGNLPSESVPRG